MRFVVDMNLSPRWIDYLQKFGHDAVHWSSVGLAGAADSEIMNWAAEHDRIVLTSDLDFGAILARSGAATPSIVQLRTESTLPVHAGRHLIDAIDRVHVDLARGALLTIEPGAARIRVLPFDLER